MGCSAVADKTSLSSFFILLAVIASQICEIPRHSEIIRSYNRSGSSKVIDLGVSRKRIMRLPNYSLIVTLDYLLPFKLTFKSRNGLFFYPSLVWRSSSG